MILIMTFDNWYLCLRTGTSYLIPSHNLRVRARRDNQEIYVSKLPETHHIMLWIG